MFPKADDEVLSVETIIDDLVDDKQGAGSISLENMLNDPEIVIIVQHIQVLDHVLISQFIACKAYQLVKDRQCIPQGTISFLRDNMQCIITGINLFTISYIFKVFCNIIHSDTLEIKDLTTRQYGRDDLVLFGGGQDEFCIGRRFFKGLQKCIESGC